MHAHRGYSVGAVDYILSPVVPDVLRTKVKVFVDLFRMSQQVRRQAEERIALAREQAARAAAEEATRRSVFLSEASKVLVSAALDPDTCARRLLRIAVPALADLGVLVVADDPARKPIALAWTDASGAVLEGLLAEPDRLHADLAASIASALARGQNRSVNSFAPGPAVGPLVSGQPEDVPEIVPASALVLPMAARGKMLGALALVSRAPRRYDSHADRLLAEDFASHAAIALDNARLYRDVQVSDLCKNEFLAMLAHELRNPLAPIRNACEIFRALAPDQPELATARDMIDRQVQNLVRLVDDLLDISRITSGKIELRCEPAEIASIVAQAVEVSRPIIE